MTKGEATVIKNAGSHFFLSRLPEEWKLFPAVLRGKVRLEGSTATNPVAVGDRVVFSASEEPSQSSPATITEILPRRNHLVRRSTNLSKQTHVIAANLDRVIVVTSLYFPAIKLPFLDRVLVSCEMYGIPAVIVLNKTDLYGDEVPEEIEHFKAIYKSAGYKVLETSVRSKESILPLKAICATGTSLMCGESGVGKSSLIKAMDPSLNLRTGDISEAHLQGTHTTSLYEMYRLSSGGGYIIDAPGLRGFGIVGNEKGETAKYFPEMLRVSDSCKFIPCTHTHEPECAVKAALQRGEIFAERYNSYLGMLEEDRKFR